MCRCKLGRQRAHDDRQRAAVERVLTYAEVLTQRQWLSLQDDPAFREYLESALSEPDREPLFGTPIAVVDAPKAKLVEAV